MRRIVKAAGQGLIIAVITLVLLELVLFSFLQFYELNTVFPYVKKQIQQYYLSRERDIIQYMPECAQYDKDLFYLFKEGACILESREFVTKYSFNRAGVRDDNASLEKPEIIVLGDSHGLGWGVDQDKIFSSVLEQQSKYTVLNSAVSSYGTVREFQLLKKLPKDGLKYLIVQYCINDRGENEDFFLNDKVLPVSDREEYDRIVRGHINRTKYEPFAFSKKLYFDLKKLLKKQDRFVFERKPEEIDQFLRVVDQNLDLIGTDVKIITFEVNGSNRNESFFDDTLKRYLGKDEFAHLQTRIISFDASSILEDEDYYILDDHLNQQGHRKIADKVLEIIE